jgi:anti-sigma factor RsiW
MNGHQKESVSALLDGQLTGLRRWLVHRHVNRCVICAAEYRRQRHVRELLAANLPAAQMSDTPEFFWSQVKRQIEASRPQNLTIPVPRLGLADWIQLHQSRIATVAAALVTAAGLFWAMQPRAMTYAKVEDVYTLLPNTEATAYTTADDGTSVIWVSGLPWASDMSEMKSQLDTQGS